MGLRGIGSHVPTITPYTKPRGRRPDWESETTRAGRVIAFIEGLVVTSGMHSGRRFLLRDWQRAIIRAWYATDADNRRIVRTGLLSMGRKNGKTSLCAALAMAHLVGPEVEARGQVVLAAADRDQASLVYNEVRAFIFANKAYRGRVNIKEHAKLIEDLVSGTTLFVVSSDAKKAHGLSPSVVIVDELAQWGTGRGVELFDALDSATGARAEPLQMIISTQAADDVALLSQLIDNGEKIRRGELTNPAFSSFHFAVPLEADPFDETQWALANPALGDFRSLEEMRVAAEKAKQMPGRLAAFRRYYLNQRVASEDRWIPPELWDACAVPAWPIPPAGTRVAYLGVDLSAKRDLTALACLVPTEEGGYQVTVDLWVPAASIAQRTNEDRVPYRQWVDEGHLTATPGAIVDYSAVRAKIAEYQRQYQLEAVAVDPWNAQDFTARLQADTIPVIEVPQSLKNLTSAAKAFEALVVDRKLQHQGNPVVKWNVTNAVVREDGEGNLKPDKERSVERIDALAAILTALAVAIVAPGESVYHTRGLLAV